MMSKWREVIIPLMLLVVSVEKCAQSLKYGANENGLEKNNWKFIQNSLRWIRSPSTNSRFRPWGGKRTPVLENPSPNIPYPDFNCLKPAHSLDLRQYSKCQHFYDSNRKNIKESQGLFNALRTYPTNFKFDEENSKENKKYEAILEKGMPETDDDGFDSGENGRQQYLVTNDQILNDSVEKRDRAFYPWAGKRSGSFYPWAGKRSGSFHPWAGKRDHAFYPWAGKRDHNFYPWAGKRGDENHTYGSDYSDTYNQESNEANRGSFEDFDETTERKRKRRDTVKDVNTDSNSINKRNYVQYLRENTKRIGVLSDLLKKFETIKEPDQRSFHPWAGRKRTEDTEISANQTNLDKNDQRSKPMQNDNQTGQESYPVNNETGSLVKRHKFYPWAGKRDPIYVV